jgi:DNA-binding CsgD family transcriptional regulator/tetratricopeptide (TPR) repeat protein
MRLVEREELFASLGACLDDAGTTGRLALVGGEAGVGKTSLARLFVEACPDGFRVLWGACDPLSTPRPLAPFQDMAPLAALLEERQERHALLTALLDELSVHTVMVVEDAHWADEATLEALRFVGRRVTGTRSVVIVTYRDDETGPGHPLRAVLGDLATAAGCERLHVPPLSPDGVRVLTAGHALDAGQLHRITGGNAFYVTEVLAAPGWTVPLSVSDAVLARVSRVSAGARGLIDLVSVAPGGLEPEIAARLVEGASAALDESVERGILVLAGGRMSFRHELARLAIEGAVAAGRRRELHARLLDLLEVRPGADLARLAHHADAAGDAERVLRYAPAAAREASARGAHREAARQLERAVAYADALPASELVDLLALLAEERIGFDTPDDRVALLERIVELRRRGGDERGVGATLALLSRTLWTQGRIREARRLVAEAVEILERLPPGPELAHAYAAYSLQEMLARRGREAVLWGSRAIELAEEVDAPVALRMALNSVGAVQVVCFEQLEGIELLERSGRIASAEGDDFEAGRALGNLGGCLEEIRQYELAVAYLERALSFAEEHDLDALEGHVRVELAKIRFEQGRWDEADRLAEQGLRHGHMSLAIPIFALCVQGRVRARRGDPDAGSFLAESLALAQRTDDVADLQWVWPPVAGCAELAWLGGRAAEIPDLVTPVYEQACELGVRWAIGELGTWLVRAGALARLPDGVPSAFAGHGRAAAAEWRRIGCPYEEAEALAEGDELAMREALAIFTALGAEPAADRLRETMRRAGLTRVPARPRASTRTAPAQLTRRQLEVLALLENGSSNAEIARRLFISEKTAGHHVSAILRKLGAGSRGEAAAAARKMGIAAPGK